MMFQQPAAVAALASGRAGTITPTRTLFVGLVILLVVLIVVLNTVTHREALEGKSSSKSSASSSGNNNNDHRNEQQQRDEAPAAGGKQLLRSVPSAAPVMPRPHVIMKTCLGPITFELRPDAAPLTVSNFLRLVKSDVWAKYAQFYRHEKGFCTQGGIPGAGWPHRVKNEYKSWLPNKQYFVSVARTPDPDSATSEFSIMRGDNSKWLGPGGSEAFGYAVFAEVVGAESIETLKKFDSAVVEKGVLTMLKPPCRIESTTVVIPKPAE